MKNFNNKLSARAMKLYSSYNYGETDYSYHSRGKNDVFADQFPVQEFNINSFGWPMSDISALSHASNEHEFEAILSRMRELQPDSSQQSLTDVDKLALVRPRILQDPVELARYNDYVAKYFMSKFSSTDSDSTDSDSTDSDSTDSDSTDSDSTDSGSADSGSV